MATSVLANQPDFAHRLDQMQQQMEQMQRSQHELREEFSGLREQFGILEERLSSRISASAHNVQARMQNLHLRNANDMLVPLHHPLTDAALANFPATPAAISALTAAVTTQLLVALNIDNTGVLEHKKRRLFRAVGLNDVVMQ